ncbi:MAG TPA: hypothetical protein VMW16_07485 [Sedimentisphaerales bacterium]|nr:hypothetical protein [Sedimentisphaerales bacterium]
MIFWRLGAVVALSDENGEIVRRYSCDVFAEVNRASGYKNPYLFTGTEAIVLQASWKIDGLVGAGIEQESGEGLVRGSEKCCN